MDNVVDFVRAKAPGPFVAELERLKRIEAAAQGFVDRWDNSSCPAWLDSVTDAVRQLRKAVR